VVITEIGGTVGDIESLPFLEAIRQFRQEVGRENALFIHLTLVPVDRGGGRAQDQATQHSVRELMQIGIQPDLLVCRSERPLSADIKRKIALFCNVDYSCVIESPDVKSIYEIPLRFREQGLRCEVCARLGTETKDPDLTRVEAAGRPLLNPSRRVRIAWSASTPTCTTPTNRCMRRWVTAASRTTSAWTSSGSGSDRFRRIRRRPGNCSRDSTGCWCQGGFGDRGVEGMIHACAGPASTGSRSSESVPRAPDRDHRVRAQRLREGGHQQHRVPARLPTPVISLLPTQRGVQDMGGTMRLGAYPARLRAGSRAAQAYGTTEISERHRHRWEVNNSYRDVLAEHGLRLSGVSPDGGLVEVIELPDHPWYIGCQFHPELKSRPNRPHALFSAFIGRPCAGAIRRCRAIATELAATR
jgi:CTP synthase